MYVDLMTWLLTGGITLEARGSRDEDGDLSQPTKTGKQHDSSFNGGKEEKENYDY